MLRKWPRCQETHLSRFLRSVWLRGGCPVLTHSILVIRIVYPGYHP